MFLIFRFDVFQHNPLDVGPGQLYWQNWNRFFYTNLEQPIRRDVPRPAILFYHGNPANPPKDPGVECLPLAVSATPPTFTAEQRPGEIRLTMPADSVIASLFRGGHPNASVWLTIFLCEDESAPMRTIFCGSVRGGAFAEMTATLQAMPVQYMLQRPASRAAFTAQCPHVLYGPLCGVGRRTNRAVGTVQSVSDDGLVLTVDGFTSPVTDPMPRPEGFLIGGHVVIEPDNYSAAAGSGPNTATPFGGVKRMILGQTSNTLTLISPVFGIEPGMRFVAYRSCAKTLTACKAFSNSRRFGGFPHIPRKDPFAEGFG